jgi:hypothetical protein
LLLTREISSGGDAAYGSQPGRSIFRISADRGGVVLILSTACPVPVMESGSMKQANSTSEAV